MNRLNRNFSLLFLYAINVIMYGTLTSKDCSGEVFFRGMEIF